MTCRPIRAFLFVLACALHASACGGSRGGGDVGAGDAHTISDVHADSATDGYARDARDVAPAEAGSDAAFDVGSAPDGDVDAATPDALDEGDAASAPDAPDATAVPDAAPDATAAACAGDTLDANRNRLLQSYYEYLRDHVTQPQTNGLSGANVTSALDVWQKLDPSARATFLTLTARMQGSLLGTDLSSMLSHVTAVYRVVGGEGATPTDPGSCGGGEYNRMIMSMDAALHAALLAANAHQGARQPDGRYDLGDVVATSSWRDSQDVGGSHAPFDLSDETKQGAPRGQTQYFADPASTPANSPLDRQDLTTLVDPYALEMDQDYDCVHNSNPLCSYVTYGRYCLPQSEELGTQIYTDSYGDYHPEWAPLPCGG